MKPLRSIPRKAVVLGVVIGFVIVGFALDVIWELKNESRNAALRSSGDVSASISHDLERSLQTYDLSLQSIVVDLTTAGVMELPPTVRDRVLFDSSTKAKYLGAILVLDSHGTVFIDSGNTIPRRESFMTTDFFRYHQSHADTGLHIGHPFKDADGVDRISLSRRLAFGDDGFAGVVVGTIDVAYFKEIFSRIDLGENSVISLTLDDGTMLMRWPFRDSDLGRNLKGTKPFDTMLARGRGDLMAKAAIDGVERQYVFRLVGPYPLLLAVAQSTTSIYGSWQERALLTGLMTLLLLVGCGALAVILKRELMRRIDAEAQLFAQSERLQVTLGSIGDAVLSTDRDGKVLYMNPVAERMSGWSIERARHRPSRDVLHFTEGYADEASRDPVATALLDGASTESGADVLLHRKHGGHYAIEYKAAPIRDSAGAIIGAVVGFHDVSEARAMVNRMSHLAQHDTLTDLPNRVLFHDRLAQAIDRANRNSQKAAVLFLDLDRFKHVNDSLGHRAGDQLLIEMARRLRECVRDADTVSRQGGDEFVVLLADLDDEQGPSRVAENILQSVAMPFLVEGNAITVTTSIGIAMYPNDGCDVTELTKHADTAMYLAKQSGRNACRFFTAELGDIASRRLNIERCIAEGFANDEFILYYQPLCRANDGLPFGAEALVRWRRDGEIVMPSDFIAIAEDCGQIIPLGDAILRMACRDAYKWNERRESPFVVAVNVSGHQFRSKGFVDRVFDILVETRLDPRCLELEITESVLLEAADETELLLGRLKEIGVGIALDDFGTGYSSLSYLSRFPVDRIKIDRSFVRSIATNDRNRAIVQAIVSLALDLGLNVIAEGVETLEQRRILAKMGCPELQGYLFGFPSPTFDGSPHMPFAEAADAPALIETSFKTT